MASLPLLAETDARPSPGGGWIATGPEPWLHAPGLERLAGRWVMLVYRQGRLDEAIRPLIRCSLADGGEQRLPLTAAPFGEARWIGRVPAGTVALSFCPVRRPGPFGFELIAARPIPRAMLIVRGLMQRPAMALTAIGARLIGARAEARHCLAFAAAISRRTTGRARHRRAFAAEPPGTPEPAVFHLMMRPGDPGAIERTRASLAESRHSHWQFWSLSEEADPDRPVVTLGGPNDWIAVLDPGDRLCPDTLAQVAAAGRREPRPDAVIGDEEVNGLYRPRPEWSPLDEEPVAGAFVRLAALPATLTMRAAASLPGLIGTTEGMRVATLFRPVWRRDRPLPTPLPASPLASDPVAAVVIPFRDQPGLLSACLAGLARTAGRLEIMLVDNGSVDPAAIRIAAEAAGSGRAALLHRPGPFNYAALCNAGAAVTHAPLLLFLNNDVEPREPDWLRRMAAQAVRPAVGAVGARLLFPNGRLQHGGVVVGMGGTALHLARGEPDRPDRWGLTNRPRRVGAVTGAVMTVERAKFDAVGGFDADAFPILLNDIDLCLRLAAHGWHSFYEPRAVLTHRESASRGRAIRPLVAHAAERARFQARWADAIRHDPGFHPALSLWSIPPALG